MRKQGYDWSSRLTRAFTQRIYLMPEQTRCPSPNEFFFQVMGSTNKAYDIRIVKGEKAWCSCPDCEGGGNFCKHLMFVMIKVLGRASDDVCEDNFDITDRCIEACQKYFVHFENAFKLVQAAEEELRKPVDDEDDCPICYESFADTKAEPLVWCKASCGKSLHRDCFEKWRKMKRDVDCVYCRAKWKN